MTPTWTAAVLGGLLIGLAVTTLLLFNGRIAGIGGALASLFSPKRAEVPWRVAFLLGIVAGGAVVSQLRPGLFAASGYLRSDLALACSGVLMGIGGRMANGCTSGHGVCGVSRGAPRSILATALFFGVALLTVALIDTFRGGVL